MWKVLIADDEPKIRRGLRKLMDWSELDMEVAGEAEDGEIALEVARELQPDILLVDICMPFLNGLQFIDQLKHIVKDCIVIVITGHDEFSYAQRAIKLQVFDYLLKPVAKPQLENVLVRAKEQLQNAYMQNRFFNWVRQEKEKNLLLLRGNFGRELIGGRLTAEDIHEQMTFLELQSAPLSGLSMMKIAGCFNRGALLQEWDRELLSFAVQNIFMEVMGQQQNMIFFEYEDNLMAITPIGNIGDWYALGGVLQHYIEKYLKLVVVILQNPLHGGLQKIADVYQEMLLEINQKVNFTPVVLLSQKYIEQHYYKEELSLQEVADSMKMSPTYLSRLLKNEMGVSFIEYLTQVRVQKAMQLMRDPKVKLYEVAELVGYSNQHYFSTAFKKVVGFSPAEYRKRGNML